MKVRFSDRGPLGAVLSLGALSLGALSLGALSLGAVACGGPDGQSGGPSSEPSAGNPVNAGPVNAGPVNAGPVNVPPPGLDDRGIPTCARYPARADGLLLDFNTYDVNDGNWGDPGRGQLTGGTSGYSCADDGSCPDSAIIARANTGDGGLRIQAVVPSQSYTGMVLWFGPCVDASAFAGLELDLGGELWGAVLSLELQTHVNYPVDLPNLKGACEYQSEEKKWSECVPPAVSVSEVSATPSQVRLDWSEFGAGTPSDGVSPDGLVGVELQFECPAEVDCAMDLTLGQLRLLAP